MALSVDIIRVDHGTEGFSFPCISFLNRRAGGAPRLLRWVYQVRECRLPFSPSLLGP